MQDFNICIYIQGGPWGWNPHFDLLPGLSKTYKLCDGTSRWEVQTGAGNFRTPQQ